MTTAQSLLTISIAVATLLGFAAGLVRHLVKYYLGELKPDGNGGHNLVGRVERIEKRVDSIYELLIDRGHKTGE
jgi:hypothetical protein